MSKGSNRRPSQIKKSDFDDRWDSTFGPVKRDPEGGVLCPNAGVFHMPKGR